MTGPLVTVAVIAYNQQDLIEETLDSVLGQDYGRLQVVVADDASSDATPEILASYQRRYADRMIVLAGERNLGVTGNCNRALPACSGELVSFLGGDDILLPGKVAAQVAWFGVDRQRVLCGHDVEHFEPDGSRWLQSDRQMGPTEGTGPEAFVANGTLFLATSVMVRREAIPPWGFDERLLVASDWKLWIDCLQGGGTFGYVPQVLGRYRHHQDSVTVTGRESCWRDSVMTLALVETEHEELIGACRKGRSRVYQERGVQCLLAGERRRAQNFLSVALTSALPRSWKLLFWWTLSYLPGSAGRRFGGMTRQLARRARARRRSEAESLPA